MDFEVTLYSESSYLKQAVRLCQHTLQNEGI